MSASKSTQAAYEVYDHQKIEFTQHLITKSPGLSTAMIFVRTREDVHALTAQLTNAGLYVDSIHGQKKSDVREKVLEAHISGKLPFLVTTDAVGRNLDITGVQNVINFDFPELPEDYITRVLKCTEGNIFSLINPKICKPLLKLEEIIERELPRATVEDFDYAKHALKVSTRNKSYKTSAGARSKPLQNKKQKLIKKKKR